MPSAGVYGQRGQGKKRQREDRRERENKIGEQEVGEGGGRGEDFNVRVLQRISHGCPEGL